MNEEIILIGIDPGSAGGIACYHSGHNKTIAISMPKTDTDIKEYFKTQKAYGLPIYVLCEKVGGYIGKRKKNILINCPHCKGLVPYTEEEGDPGSRMFTFGDGNGYIRGVCLALDFHWEIPMVPRSWQKVHGLFKPKGISKNRWKGILKDAAQKKFPELRVTLNTADALLILDVLIRMKIRFVEQQTRLPF
jgi:hypothetical protein